MATSFSDLQIDRVVPVNEFIDSIKNPIKKEMIAYLIEWSTSIYPLIRNATLNLPSEPPILRVSNELEPQAQCMEGLIEISSGLINYCLGIQFLDVESVLNIQANVGPMFFPASTLTWFYSHECFHIGRQHNLLLDHVEADPNTLRAIERDADLCAVAVLYRAYQAHFQNRLTDDELRKLVLYAVFWALRTLTDKPQLTHSRPDDRIIYATMKLAIVTESQSTSHVDVGMAWPETRARANSLFETLAAIDKSFRAANPDIVSDFSLRARLEEKANGVGDQSTEFWDAIRIKHSVLTGQRS